jgi:hypothetical protein
MEYPMSLQTSLKFTRRGIFAVAAITLLTGFSLESLFAPSAELWPEWRAHNAQSTTRVDHGAWDGLLARYRNQGKDGIARVAYQEFSDADRKALKLYVAGLTKTSVSQLNRPEQFAYWVNLYNALTVKIILDNGIPKSIRDIDISPGFLADGPWDKKLATIEGREVSLNDIEHRILRPIFKDPRIHYAVNCASLGCPDLPAVAFTAANTEQLLEAAARAYVNHPRGAKLVDGLLHVSSIYVWFAGDFGGEEGVLRHLARYARPDLAKGISKLTATAGHSYDWRLNGAGS